MNKILQIALLLTAVDKMSDVAEKATSNVKRSMAKMKDGYSELMTGMAQAMSGKMLIDNTVKPMTSAFNQVQDHATNLRIAMMKDGGTINENFFKKLYRSSEIMSEKFGENRNDYLDMFKVLKSHHMNETDLFGGFGEQMASWSKLMETSPVNGTKFIAGLKMDLNLTNAELVKMMDLTQRLHFGEGVGATGGEAIDMLKESFSIASLGMTNLKYTGFTAARDFSAMLVPFLRRQISPETMGTGFRKIWANMLDKDKMKEFDAVAASYGKKFEFFDKKGNFMGLENFMRQMDLFKGMSMPDVNTILQPLTGGKTGISSDVFKILAQEGSEGFNAGLKSIYAQGEMHARLAERMRQQSVQQARLEQMWNNAKVQIGSTLLPMMVTLTTRLMQVAHAIRSFASAHPAITATVFKMITFVGSIMMLSGSLKILKGLWLITSGSFGMVVGVLGKLAGHVAACGRLFLFLGRMAMMAAPGLWAMASALLANPITWIVLGVVALIAAIVLLAKHWKPLGDFFRATWDLIKALFRTGVAAIKFVLLNFTPVGLIFKHWDKLSPYFKRIWGAVLGIFHWIYDKVKAFLLPFFNAGKNLIMMVAHGIKAGAEHAIKAMTHVVQKLRNMLPFSPAKEGPLRDIHRIRLIETIADSIKPTALLEKMKSVTQAVFNFTPMGIASQMSSPNSASIAGAGMVVHYAPQYNARPGGTFAADKEEFMAFMNKNKREVVDVIDSEWKRRNSRTY